MAAQIVGFFGTSKHGWLPGGNVMYQLSCCAGCMCESIRLLYSGLLSEALC